MAKTSKITVSRRALIQRINRKIWDDDLTLRTARSERARLDLGDYYTVNFRINGLAERNIDLEDYAREVGVLREYERLDKD